MTGIRTETGVWLDISPDAEFELSIENPLLRDDRIPSLWSTDISLPPTPLNKRVLGYMGALMAAPAVKKLKATIEAGGLGIFEGTLEYDSIDENGNLLYTFSARNLDDDWDIKIHELPGLLYGHNSGHDYDSLMAALKAGEIDGVSLPLIINESLVGDTACIDRLDMGDWRPGTGSTRPGTGGSGNRRLADLDWGNLDMKYRNSPGATEFPSTIPAVTVMRLLEAAIGRDGAGDLEPELSRLVIFATWWTNFPLNTKTVAFDYDIAGALPDISLKDLIKSVCSMFCAAVFSDRNRFSIHTFRAVHDSPEILDWTDKVGDVFTSERESAQGYELSYSGSSEESSGALEKDAYVDSLAELLDIDSEEYETVEHTVLGEIYSAKSVDTEVYITGTDSNPGGSYKNIKEVLCDQLSEAAPAAYGEDKKDQMSVQIDLRLPRFAPTIHHWFDYAFLEIRSAELMAALLELPSVESERPTDAYVAVLYEGQASGKGTVIGKDGDISAGLDITPSALFAGYHRGFAEWIGNDRQRLAVSLNMSIYEAANFRMWRKVQVLGRVFLVEKLTIRFRAGSDETDISADLMGL